MQLRGETNHKVIKPNTGVISQPVANRKSLDDSQTLKSLPVLSNSLQARFQVTEKLGSGSFGHIYKAFDCQRSEYVALKIENHPVSATAGTATSALTLGREAKILSEIGGAVGIPSVYYFTKEDTYSVLELGLLGPNLEKLCKGCGRKLSLKTVLLLAEQMLKRIEYIHSRGYLHRDIKPENFVMGHSAQESKNLYLIDFGLSKMYRESPSGKHISYKENKGLIGTARYASISTHLGIEQSRRDDLESIGYLLVYFLKGGLPWQNIRAQNKTEKYKLIADCKMNIPIEELCKGIPREFISYMHHVRNLTFTDAPDYKYLRKIFRKLLSDNGWTMDYDYDWQTPPGRIEIPRHRHSETATVIRAMNGKETPHAHDKKGDNFDDMRPRGIEVNPEFRKSTLKMNITASNAYNKHHTSTSRADDSIAGSPGKHESRSRGSFLVKQPSGLSGLHTSAFNFQTIQGFGTSPTTLGNETTNNKKSLRNAWKHLNTAVEPYPEGRLPLSSFNQKENENSRIMLKKAGTMNARRIKLPDSIKPKPHGSIVPLDIQFLQCESLTNSALSPLCKSSRNMMPEKPIFSICCVADVERDEPDSPVFSGKESTIDCKVRKPAALKKRVSHEKEVRHVRTVVNIKREEHDFAEDEIHERSSLEIMVYPCFETLSVKRLEELKYRNPTQEREVTSKATGGILTNTKSNRDYREINLFRNSLVSTGTGMPKASLCVDS